MMISSFLFVFGSVIVCDFNIYHRTSHKMKEVITLEGSSMHQTLTPKVRELMAQKLQKEHQRTLVCTLSGFRARLLELLVIM